MLTGMPSRWIRLLIAWMAVSAYGVRAQTATEPFVPYAEVPIAEALRAAPGEVYGVTGTVTVVLAPGYLFLQDESGAMRAIVHHPPPIVIGDRLHLVVRKANMPGRWFESMQVENLGPASLPVPEIIQAGSATPAQYDASFVTVRGRVIGLFHNTPTYELDGRIYRPQREGLLIEAEGGGNLHIIFDPSDRAHERYPAGTVAEFTGACRFPEAFNPSDVTLFSISVRGTDRVRILQGPPLWMQPQFRLWLGRSALAAAITASGLIIWMLWRWRRRQLAHAADMRFRALVENAFDGVLVFKPDGSLLYRNSFAVQLFGEAIRGDLLLRDGVSPRIHPEDAPRIIATMKNLLSKPGYTSSTIGYRVHPPEGGTRHVEAIGMNCLDIPGIEGVVVNVRDITERHESEARLREANASLEQRVAERTADLLQTQEDLRTALRAEKELSELRANFVSLVSHEFRTPLGVIMSAADVLRLFNHEISDNQREHHLEMITRSTRTLANLIEEVLFIRRVEEGKQRFEPTPVDLPQLCSVLVDEILSASNRVCPIHLTYGSSLDCAMSDETLLRHILSNLLSNAVKYSDPGKAVEFSAKRRGNCASFTVRDQGIGILPEDRAHLFESFMRGRNVGTRPGNGLGLIVVKRCVDLHGGTLDLQSEPGVGTSVTVTLPVFENNDDD